MLNNKNILITGGTGSFGNELVPFLLKKFNPRKVIIFSRDEYKQSIMKSKFKDSEIKKLRFLLGDVRDIERLKMAMRDVDFVIHAAALKQVPAAEYNPMEFVKTNIHGAENVVLAALHNNVKKIIALSTDKAANPINLYGSTKLASDKIFIAANKITGVNKNKFSIVRYGNVIGSRGSVIPIFKEFIQKKKNYFPITDKRMTRFWFTLQDSVKFVLQCLKIMEGGEIFVPKIPSIRITDLAKAMNSNYKLKIIGIRPGEKIHEQMCPAESSLNTLEYKKFYIIYPPDVDVKKKLNTFKKNINETGKKVKIGYEYNSINNNNFLSVSQIKSLNKKLKF
jgi:UDP-N-acetylglucosamine 4,6-dehydratase/5-epimerase